MRKSLLAALAAGLFLAAPAARAEIGIMTCQIMVSDLAADAAGSRLSENQMAAIASLVEVGRSQCRSSPAIVNAKIQSLRQAIPLGSESQVASGEFDDFWPADDELAELR